MRCIKIYAPGDVRFEEVDEPIPGPQDVLVKVSDCGICGTDLGYIKAGGLIGPMPKPMALGHEVSGVIAAVGEEVDSIQVGMRVVANPLGANNLIGNGGSEGAFADYLLVRNAAKGGCVFEIPDALSMQEAALTEPLAVAMHAVNQGAPEKADKVAVFGAGPIGLGAVAALRYRGVEDIIAVDMSVKRRAIAEKMGARGSCHPKDALAYLSEMQGRDSLYGSAVAGTDLYIDAAGVGQVVRDVLGLAKPGARLVVVGLHKEEVLFDFRSLLMRELSVIGSIGYPTEFPDVLKMLASGQVKTQAMRTHVLPFAEFDAALEVARNGEEAAKVLVEISV